MKFSEFVEEWNSVCRLNTSDGWKMSQDQMLRDYILPIIGAVSMSAITHFHISKILSDAKNRKRSLQTLKHIYSLLNSMFTHARDDFELIGKSPIKTKLHRPIVPTAERKYLEPEDAKFLLMGVLKLAPGYRSDLTYALPIWLGVFCGLRIGELIGLKWEDVNFKNRSILVNRAWDSKMNRFNKYTKNKTQVRVPMPEPLHEMMLKLKGSPGTFVCRTQWTGKQLSRHTFHRALKRICKRMGLPELSAHEMRHTCSELWIYHGATVEDIRRLLNHGSVASTKTYIHRTDSRLQAIAKTVTAGLTQIYPSKKAA